MEGVTRRGAQVLKLLILLSITIVIIILLLVIAWDFYFKWFAGWPEKCFGQKMLPDNSPKSPVLDLRSIPAINILI